MIRQFLKNVCLLAHIVQDGKFAVYQNSWSDIFQLNSPHPREHKQPCALCSLPHSAVISEQRMVAAINKLLQLTRTSKGNKLNSQSRLKQPKTILSIIATTLVALTAISLVAACSPKPTAEESAAQTKVMVDQAVAEAKKEMIAEKDKQDAVATAQSEEKIKQDAAVKEAVANERKRVAAEQRATNATNERRASAAKSNSSNPVHESTDACSHCGVVLSVTENETEGSGSGLGAVAGGVLGGVLGNQVGAGTGRNLATIAGAVGGAYAGNKVEKITKKTIIYTIVVKMNTGEELAFNQSTVPNVARGDKVRIKNDVVVRR